MKTKEVAMEAAPGGIVMAQTDRLKAVRERIARQIEGIEAKRERCGLGTNPIEYRTLTWVLDLIDGRKS